MNDKERQELFNLNHYVLTEKILPLVKSDDLKKKIYYIFKGDNIEFYLATYYIWHHYETWKQEVKEELDRIYKEHGVRLFEKLY